MRGPSGLRPGEILPACPGAGRSDRPHHDGHGLEVPLQSESGSTRRMPRFFDCGARRGFKGTEHPGSRVQRIPGIGAAGRVQHGPGASDGLARLRVLADRPAWPHGQGLSRAPVRACQGLGQPRDGVRKPRPGRKSRPGHRRRRLGASEDRPRRQVAADARRRLRRAVGHRPRRPRPRRHGEDAPGPAGHRGPTDRRHRRPRRDHLQAAAAIRQIRPDQNGGRVEPSAGVEDHARGMVRASGGRAGTDP